MAGFGSNSQSYATPIAVDSPCTETMRSSIPIIERISLQHRRPRRIIHVIGPATQQGSPILANIFYCWPSNIIPTVVDLVDGSIPIQRKRVRNIDFAMSWICSIDHLQFVEQPAVGIDQKGPLGGQGVPGLIGIRFVICRDGDQFAVINSHLRLQMSHVVRQLTTIFGSVMAPAENKGARKPPQKL